MTHLITPREIQRWFPQRWDEIVGNSSLIQELRQMITVGGTNMMVTGPMRTGKTRTISLAIKAALCPCRSDQLDPCGICNSCLALNDAREGHHGTMTVWFDSTSSYFVIDCENVTAEELRSLIRDVKLEFEKTYVYLDEVAALGRRGLDSFLLKAIDETPAKWIASAVAVRKQNDTIARAPGLTDPMLARFAVKVGTAQPLEPELTDWIKARCNQWTLLIEDEHKTLPLLAARSRYRAGMVILVLAVAASRDRRLTLDLVDGFDFQALE